MGWLSSSVIAAFELGRNGQGTKKKYKQITHDFRLWVYNLRRLIFIGFQKVIHF